MYEFCARNGMEDAKAGILRSMRVKFQLNEDSVMSLSDPFETARKLVHIGHHDEALQALELALGTTKGMDTSASSKHFGVQLLLKVHMCTDYLKAMDANAEDYKATVNSLFPPAPQGRRPAGGDDEAQVKRCIEVRKRLLQVAHNFTKQTINNLLDEFPVHELREEFDLYVNEAHNIFQGPTMLERIFDDMDKGIYAPTKHDTGDVAAKSSSSDKRARPSGVDDRQRQKAMDALAEEPKRAAGRVKAVARDMRKDQEEEDQGIEVIDDVEEEKVVARGRGRPSNEAKEEEAANGKAGKRSSGSSEEEDEEEEFAPKKKAATEPAKKGRGRPRKLKKEEEEESEEEESEEEEKPVKRKPGRPRKVPEVNELEEEEEEEEEEEGEIVPEDMSKIELSFPSIVMQFVPTKASDLASCIQGFEGAIPGPARELLSSALAILKQCYDVVDEARDAAGGAIGGMSAEVGFDDAAGDPGRKTMDVKSTVVARMPPAQPGSTGTADSFTPLIPSTSKEPAVLAAEPQPGGPDTPKLEEEEEYEMQPAGALHPPPQPPARRTPAYTFAASARFQGTVPTNSLLDEEMDPQPVLVKKKKVVMRVIEPEEPPTPPDLEQADGGEKPWYRAEPEKLILVPMALFLALALIIMGDMALSEDCGCYVCP